MQYKYHMLKNETDSHEKRVRIFEFVIIYLRYISFAKELS